MRAPTVTRGSIAQVSHHGRVENDQGKGDARYEHQSDGGELEAVLALLGTSIEAHDDCDRQVAIEERRAERQGSCRPTDGKDSDARAPPEAMNGPRSARYTRVATTHAIASNARLNASFIGDCRRIAPRTIATPSTRQMTRTAGDAITSPSNNGTSPNTNR